MTRVSHTDDPEAGRLREAIAAELIALARAFSFGTRAVSSGEDVADQVAGVLRSNPAWAAGVLAGVLAGVASAVRRRARRPDEP
jgi:hypothetical protein